MEQKPFSAWRAVENDFSLTLPMLVPFVAWVMYLLPLVIVGSSPLCLSLAVIATIAGPAVLAWKLAGIRRVFLEGQALTGVIRSTQFIKDRGRINYDYSYAGQDYPGTVTVHVTDRTKSFWNGQEVELVLDPAKPQQAYLRGLYS
jgi:hypothetical protein